MNILEAIRQRHSVRTYDGSPLSDSEKDLIIQSIDSAGSPFGEQTEIIFHDFGAEGDFSPSTYGTIRRARAYLMMALADDDRSWLSGGFRMEQVILEATRLGLGTCWIAATFSGTDFSRAATWDDGLSLRIVSPVGHPAGKRSIYDRITRAIAHSDRRKNFGELFFKESFDSPLEQSGSTFGEALEMMRLAPSSVNSQPWRAVVTDSGDVHFYCVSRTASKQRLALLDCGIGLCHFKLAEEFNNAAGDFYSADQHPDAPSGVKYICSYHRRQSTGSDK